jgi:hypothetical protein
VDGGGFRRRTLQPEGDRSTGVLADFRQLCLIKGNASERIVSVL